MSDKTPKKQQPMFWTYSAIASMSFTYDLRLTEEQKAEKRAQALFDEAEYSIMRRHIEGQYQKAIITGLGFSFKNTKELIKLIQESHLDKKYRKAVSDNIDRLKHSRKHDFLEKYYSKIDCLVEVLNMFLSLYKIYWLHEDLKEADKPRGIYSTHIFFSKSIKTYNAKKNKEPKFLETTIHYCEKQIEIAKSVAKQLLKKEKRYSLKSYQELMDVFNAGNARGLEILRRINAGIKNINPGNIQNKKPVDKYKGVKLPKGFDPAIHKSPDDFVVITEKLGEHTGYKQLCIIREGQGNWQEVLRLAEQAKAEGWAGDWDKRIEKAKKKMQPAQE